MIISKYIGETEKNLSRVLKHAATSDEILPFDEEDALLSKRTKVETPTTRTRASKRISSCNRSRGTLVM
jgi:SpoVK/Ycf46/Vps4 family AAA+-type ATPase